MSRNRDAPSVLLVLGAGAALAYGLWLLTAPSELPGLYWVTAGGLALEAARQRERFLGTH